MIRQTLFLLVGGATGAAPAFAADDDYSIDVTVSGAKPGVGQVLISLFDSSGDYLEHPVLEVKGQVDGDGRAFAGLGEWKPGEYAVVVVYDENENGKLDTGIFRIPKEKIGFSNDAKGRLGPATWDDARFVLTNSDVSIDVQLADAGQDE